MHSAKSVEEAVLFLAEKIKGEEKKYKREKV